MEDSPFGNRPERIKADLCVIGAGSAGLSVATGAAQLGASVVLIEKGRMGGDCLNTGCVPSKALIAAAKAAHAPRTGRAFGVDLDLAGVDFRRVHRYVHSVIAAIAPHDSVERFEGLGMRVIRGAAQFTSPREVEAGGIRISARRIVIATGSVPTVPPISGLDRVPFLTNESIFDLTERPAHLLIIGGGPIGCELAQAFARLGSRVTLIEQAAILPRDEPEAVEIIRRALVADGVEVIEAAQVKSVAGAEGVITLSVERDGSPVQIGGSHLLIAAGRKPCLDGLNLDAAGISYSAKGIEVDGRLLTSNRRIFAIGDCAGGPQFTHVAGYQAAIVIRNALFGWPAKADYRALPWVTFTDPELAHAGLTEAEARTKGHDVKTVICPFTENDRAQTERRTEGLAKIVLNRNGRIFGATIAGAHAGELIALWSLAISSQMRLSKIASLIVPYPTFSEISKRAAGGFYAPKLFSERTRKLVRFIQKVLP